jgi:hypothetical protein
MNLLEKKMVDILKDLRENHHVVGVKAEFEAEGTRLEEALRLKDVISTADLNLTIKIGGCEALRDLYESRTIGVERIVAPMVESAYSLHKYLGAVDLAYPKEEQQFVQFAINIETGLAVQNFEAMLALPEIGRLNCIVLGRVDLTGSLGMGRDEVNSERVFEIAKKVLTGAKAKGIETTIGGGVAAQALPFFRALPPGSLDRYETRKILFKCPEALEPHAPDGILKAVGFELMWLKNKRDYYKLIAEEDAQRIVMLESRYRKMIESVGGVVE